MIRQPDELADRRRPMEPKHRLIHATGGTAESGADAGLGAASNNSSTVLGARDRLRVAFLAGRLTEVFFGLRAWTRWTASRNALCAFFAALAALRAALRASLNAFLAALSRALLALACFSARASRASAALATDVPASTVNTTTAGFLDGTGRDLVFMTGG